MPYLMKNIGSKQSKCVECTQCRKGTLQRGLEQKLELCHCTDCLQDAPWNLPILTENSESFNSFVSVRLQHLNEYINEQEYWYWYNKNITQDMNKGANLHQVPSSH